MNHQQQPRRDPVFSNPGVILIIFGLIGLSLNQYYNKHIYRTVFVFNEPNVVIIQNSITEESMNTTINQINGFKNNKTINMIINSRGGNYMSGYNLIRAMQSLSKTQNKVFHCYAINAHSTAFTIFQICDKRFVTPTTKLFQHNMTVSFSIEEFVIILKYTRVEHIQNAYNKIEKIYTKMNKFIADRIGMEYTEYMKRVHQDWTIQGGKQITNNHLADEIVILRDVFTQK